MGKKELENATERKRNNSSGDEAAKKTIIVVASRKHSPPIESDVAGAPLPPPRRCPSRDRSVGRSGRRAFRFFGRRAVAKRVGFLPREAGSGAWALPSLADAALRAVDSLGRDFVDGLWPKKRRHRRWGERARARARASYGRAFSPSPESWRLSSSTECCRFLMSRLLNKMNASWHVGCAFPFWWCAKLSYGGAGFWRR